MSLPTDEALADWFTAGLAPEDVPALHALKPAEASIQALSTLFRGGDAAVRVRLLVLRELGARAEPFFTRGEIAQAFPYLDPNKLDHLVTHLRVNGLLALDAESGRYRISPVGRRVLAALSQLFHFEEPGAELGYLAGQLAAGSALGRVTQEQLNHLLARLVELKDGFERAILSGSERRIRAAEAQLEKVWDWVDKGSAILKELIDSTELDGAAHRVAQRIGQVQSELLRMSGAFQRVLNQLEQQRVHLGRGGLSSTDVAAWLRGRSIDQLCALAADGAVAAQPDFAFALGDIALDIAEFELVDKTRPERLNVPLPEAAAAPAEPPPGESEDFTVLTAWLDELAVAPDGLPLSEAVPWRDFEHSSYRYSVLALIGDAESRSGGAVLNRLARLPLTLSLTGAAQPVQRHGVAELSEGHLHHRSPDGA